MAANREISYSRAWDMNITWPGAGISLRGPAVERLRRGLVKLVLSIIRYANTRDGSRLAEVTVGSRTGQAAAGLDRRSPAEDWTGQHGGSSGVANVRMVVVVVAMVALLRRRLAVLLPVGRALALVASVVGHGRGDRKATMRVWQCN